MVVFREVTGLVFEEENRISTCLSSCCLFEVSRVCSFVENEVF